MKLIVLSEISTYKDARPEVINILRRYDDEKVPEDLHNVFSLWVMESDPIWYVTRGKDSPFANIIIKWWLDDKTVEMPNDQKTIRKALKLYTLLYEKIDKLRDPGFLLRFKSPQDLIKLLNQLSARHERN